MSRDIVVRKFSFRSNALILLKKNLKELKDRFSPQVPLKRTACYKSLRLLPSQKTV